MRDSLALGGGLYQFFSEAHATPRHSSSRETTTRACAGEVKAHDSGVL
jgi:hypothetical protein